MTNSKAPQPTRGVRLNLIAAVGSNGAIGRAGDIPWRLPNDMAWFKRATARSILLMGRKTWDSLRVRPLPGRISIVLSGNPRGAAPGAIWCTAIEDALGLARQLGERMELAEIWCIGGTALFALTLPYASTLYLTRVDDAPEADAFFPEIDPTDWREVSSTPIEESPKAALVELVRNRAPRPLP